jgi:hypothetical protein
VSKKCYFWKFIWIFGRIEKRCRMGGIEYCEKRAEKCTGWGIKDLFGGSDEWVYSHGEL